MQALVTRVTAIRPLGDNLTVVTVDDHEVVANRREDGSFRWEVGEPVVYVPEGAIVPDDVLKERGYWDETKDRGLLEGKKYNRVKMRRFGPEEDRVESRGLLFKTRLGSFKSEPVLYVDRADQSHGVDIGDDLFEFLGLVEFKA